jgi:homeobox-leucine zipper protein
MDAELKVLSPGMTARKIKFLRQCKEVQPGKWAVVDVSVDGILGLDDGVPPTCRLLPSGCLIEVHNTGCCKVHIYSLEPFILKIQR